MKQPRPSFWALLLALFAGGMATFAYYDWQDGSEIAFLFVILSVALGGFAYFMNEFSHDEFVSRILEWDAYRARKRRHGEAHDWPHESEPGT